ncbi:MAG: DUF4363 family protein [Oscillospiraceae bacterium]|nr:DUF4363 family protein [Oscillospiraceae bacterium]
MIAQLRELREEIEKASEDTNINLEEMSNQVHTKWEEIRKVWSVIVLHQELDVISVSLISMQSNIKTSEYNRALEEIDRAIFLLEDIVEKERFALRNIL